MGFLVFGQGKLSEKQYFANEYKRSCMWTTGLWLLWSMWIFNDKWDSVSFLVKSNKTPQVIILFSRRIYKCSLISNRTAYFFLLKWKSDRQVTLCC